MNKFFEWFFAPTKKEDRGAFALADKIIELKKRVEELEVENEQLKQVVSEIHTNLQEQIDNIHPVIYNFTESKD